MADDLLGGGLDIEGWSFIKHEPSRNSSDLVDKSYLHRQQVPLLVKCNLTHEQYRQVHDIVIYSIEVKSQIDPPWIAQRIKMGLDVEFGGSWHVIVGEEFTFDIEYEDVYLYYVVYSSYAILAWKCGAVMPSEINHMDDPKTKEKLKEAKLRKENKKKRDNKATIDKKKVENLFSDRI